MARLRQNSVATCVKTALTQIQVSFPGVVVDTCKVLIAADGETSIGYALKGLIGTTKGCVNHKLVTGLPVYTNTVDMAADMTRLGLTFYSLESGAVKLNVSRNTLTADAQILVEAEGEST